MTNQCAMATDNPERQRRLSRRALPAAMCCRSSVVERILGKAEVVSSILTGSTIFTIFLSPQGIGTGDWK